MGHFEVLVCFSIIPALYRFRAVQKYRVRVLFDMEYGLLFLHKKEDHISHIPIYETKTALGAINLLTNSIISAGTPQVLEQWTASLHLNLICHFIPACQRNVAISASNTKIIYFPILQKLLQGSTSQAAFHNVETWGRGG